MQKRVTLSFDSNVYDQFQKFCEENDIILSRRLQRLMEEHIKQNKLKKNKI